MILPLLIQSLIKLVKFDLSLFRKPLTRKIFFDCEKGNILFDINLGTLIINSEKGKKFANNFKKR